MPGPRRDMVGYGRNPPKFLWPGRKSLAVSIVVNYEEGSEHSHTLDRFVEGIGEFLPVDVPAQGLGERERL